MRLGPRLVRVDEHVIMQWIEERRVAAGAPDQLAAGREKLREAAAARKAATK